MELAKLRRELHQASGEDAASEALKGFQDLAARAPQNVRIRSYVKEAEELSKDLR
jgi:hypothetical protein